MDLYKVALDEYRFEVRLNWDRMQYYVVVNSGIVAVGTTLLKDATSAGVTLLCGTIFLVGIGMAIIGMIAIHKGREYYQATIYKKTVFEELLGLNEPVLGPDRPKATLAVATTAGMGEVNQILDGKPGTPFRKRFFRKRIVSYFIWLLLLLTSINVAGLSYSVYRAVTLATERPAAKPQSTPPTKDTASRVAPPRPSVVADKIVSAPAGETAASAPRK